VPEKLGEPNYQEPQGPRSGRKAAEDPQEEADERHDLGPWIETPNSSRVLRYRFDYGSRTLQVLWRKPGGSHGAGTLYSDVDYEQFRSFGRAISKGRAVNSILNSLSYEPLGNDHHVPSNDRRRPPSSRFRHSGPAAWTTIVDPSGRTSPDAGQPSKD